jgi:undecaprenyl phosphate-alpha-L-ara4N flippase subunit ArnF
MIYALTSVLLNAFAQLAMKEITKHVSMSPSLLVKDIWIYLVGFLYISSIGVWFLALKVLPVSKAYPLQSLGYVLVSVFAWYLFAEKINILGLCGLALICLGAVLVSFK